MTTSKEKEGHRQRLREKFLKNGLDGFHDYEIIELLLTLGTPRTDCKQSAKDALKTFGSLKAVLEADPKELIKIKGIGNNNVFGLKMTQDVARRYLADRIVAVPKTHLRANERLRYLVFRLLLEKKNITCLVH